MGKKLPSVFANKIEKNINNNERVYYSKKEEQNDENRGEKNYQKLDSNLNINQKINKIFSSTNYVYKMNVRIILKDNKIERKIIGKNATHLITMENELIPIGDIIDIEIIK